MPAQSPSSQQTVPSALTYELISSAIDQLSIQHRTMLHLLLLQYFDVSQEEIEYMAADQPDSRFLAGNQPATKRLTKEAIQHVTDRVGQYRLFLRQKRERPALQITCLQRQISRTDMILAVIERLLTSRFSVEPSRLEACKQQAFSVLVKQERRKLDAAWKQHELSEDEYKIRRLLLEYQIFVRKRRQYTRRLTVAKQEFQFASTTPLKDHEIAHIWGIPLGSLASRKVKALEHYLTKIQEMLEQASPTANQNPVSTHRPNYWQDTFLVLSRRPIERSIVSYDGLERTEENLMLKLRAFAEGTMAEEEDSKFWTTITKIQDSEHSGMWASHSRSIFALQRLIAIHNDLDSSEDAIEEEIIARIDPQRLDEPVPGHTIERPQELSEEAL
ncbi:MAG: hypothetical protein D6690_16030, partial [Nitrospirae bacterium]